jgi:hypothetical protein
MVAEGWASQLTRRSTFVAVLHGRSLENGSGKGEEFILKYFRKSTFSGTVFEGLESGADLAPNLLLEPKDSVSGFWVCSGHANPCSSAGIALRGRSPTVSHSTDMVRSCRLLRAVHGE